MRESVWYLFHSAVGCSVVGQVAFSLEMQHNGNGGLLRSVFSGDCVVRGGRDLGNGHCGGGGVVEGDRGWNGRRGLEVAPPPRGCAQRVLSGCALPRIRAGPAAVEPLE